MKLTKLKLKQIIKEELNKALDEQRFGAKAPWYREHDELERILGAGVMRSIDSCFPNPDYDGSDYDLPTNVKAVVDVMYLRQSPSMQEGMCLFSKAPEIIRQLQGGDPPWLKR